MRHRLLLVAAGAAMVCASGCARSMGHATMKPDYTPVSVRFVLPPEPQRFTDVISERDMRLVTDTTYSGMVERTAANDTTMTEPRVVHVALWGGGFTGHDMTYDAAYLNPGSYTFAFLDPDNTTAVQGWMDVRPGGTEIVDFLQRWRDSIPQQKQGLAYDLEINGRIRGKDTEVFKSFARQLRAFDRLERELTTAIEEEKRAQWQTQQQYNNFLRSAEVLLFPGGKAFFQPTTQPAFTANEIKQVRAGKPMTKLMLMADYNNAQWKLAQINRVCGELNRCKSVMMEEAERLERRKRFYTLTDHLYQHDRKFVQNEIQLQQTLASIDRLNEQIGELRERRLALAFVSELAAPNQSLRPLDQEQNDLVRERTVLETMKQRIDHMYNEAEPTSHKRVILERNRQEAMRNLEMVHDQINRLAEARVAVQSLRKDSNVIHRQGDLQLLAASFVDTNMPIRVRQAIEREAMMTVRLQATDSMFVPMSTVTYRDDYDTTTRVAYYPAQSPRHSQSPRGGYAGQRQSGAYGQPAHTSRQAQTQPAPCQTRSAQSQPSQQRQQQDFAQSQPSQSGQRTAQSRSTQPQSTPTRSAHVQPAPSQSQPKSAQPGYAQPQRDAKLTGLKSDQPQTGSKAGRAQSGSGTAQQPGRECDCPLLLRILVPPCWFLD